MSAKTDLCPRCADHGIMAIADGLTCAMAHGESDQSWARRKGVPALEDQPGFARAATVAAPAAKEHQAELPMR